jgi:hypothetical protein
MVPLFIDHVEVGLTAAGHIRLGLFVARRAREMVTRQAWQILGTMDLEVPL